MLAANPAAAAPADAYATIERLELTRSLGGRALAAFLDDRRPSVAARAALALGRTKQLLAVEPLLAHADVSDPGVRALVIFGLGLLAEPLAAASAAPAATVPARTASTPASKGRGVEVTIDAGAMLRPLMRDLRAKASAAIVNAMADGSEAVRLAAFDAAGRYAINRTFAPSDLDRSFNRLEHDVRGNPSPLIRARAATALEAYSGVTSLHARALATLAGAFTGEDDATARWHIIWSIARGFSKDAPRQLLTSALADRDEIVRLQAIRALGRSGDASLVATLEPLAHDPSWRISEEAREAQAALRGEKRTEHLTAIPDGVRTPEPQASADAGSALPRPAVPAAKPARPTLAEIRLTPHLDPRTPRLFTGPAPGPHPRVRITTTKGTLVLVLFPEWAPSTVANFLNLTNRGYYDGLRWFRIVPDFVAQTGDPSDNGEGDAGYMIPAEENPLEQDTGVISMGLNYSAGHPLRDSAGTQFYITLAPQLHLNRDFTVFGKVESGFDVLGRLIESDRMTRVEQLGSERLNP